MVRASDITVYSVVFGDEYGAWGRALERSLKKNAPEHKVRIYSMPAPEAREGLPGWVTGNHEKLKAWWRIVKYLTLAEPFVLLDADTLVLRGLEGAFVREFDVGYTVREADPPYNCGAIYVRPSAASLEFFRRWVQEDTRLVRGGAGSMAEINASCGCNQASFRAARGRMGGSLKTERLPCWRWNCEQTSYELFGPETAVLHIKSWLRQVVLYDLPVADDAVELARRFADDAVELARRLVPVVKEYLHG